MNKKREKFAKIEMEMIYSPAYIDLSAKALIILSYVLLQTEWINTQPRTRKAKWEMADKDFFILYNHFLNSPFNMHNQTVTRAIDSLLAHGFMEVVKQGGRQQGSKTIFKRTPDWKTWKPGEIIFKRQPFFAKGFCK